MDQDERNKAVVQLISESVLYCQEKGFRSPEVMAALASVFVTGLIAAEGRDRAIEILYEMAADIRAGQSIH